MKTHPLQLAIACFAFLAINAPAATLYVDVNSTNPTSPYADWSTAATNIQNAVDASTNGDLILVTNGIYQTGGAGLVFSPPPGGSYTESNRVAVTKAVTVQSVNGSAATIIRGYQVPGTTNGNTALRCVYLTNGASLSGFTLLNGATHIGGNGGGVFCLSNATVFGCIISNNAASLAGGGAFNGTLSNCTLIGNSATNGGGAGFGTLNNCTLAGNSASRFGGGTYSNTLNNCTLAANSDADAGGGAAFSTLNNCTLAGNLATNVGGGAFVSTLNNCTLTGNSASYGGGAGFGTLNNCTLTGNSAANAGGGVDGTPMNINNCIVYYNTAPSSANYYLGTLNNCCTTPLPGVGAGNFTNAPLFVDLFSGNLRLQSNSPCINAGNNAYVVGSTDLDGRPRIVNGTVDIGTYEFQGAGMSEFIGWLQQCGLPTDGSADYADADGDGMDNWKEWRTGTIPTNASSLLKMTTVTNDVSGITVTWQSVSGVTYFLQRDTNFLVRPAFQTVATDIAGQPDTTSYTDTDAVGAGPFFYRVGVQ